jgi:Uma2 family endonuclease
VPEYWLVNLVDDVIEVFTRPLRGRYTKHRLASRGERLTLVRFPDVTIAVDDVLPT